MISDKYQYIRNNASHDLTLIKMIVARFVGTGISPSRHSNERIANLKSSPIIFNKTLFL